MKYIFFIVLLLIPVFAMAVPTGTAIIPTADVLLFGETKGTYEFNGSGRLDESTTDGTYGLQTGMIGGIETGIDYGSDSKPFYNAKWQYTDGNGIVPAIAIGIQNLGSQRQIQYYAVATLSTPYKLMSASFGVLRKSKSQYISMASAEAKYDMVKISADYANGGGFNRHSYSAGLETNNITLTYTRYYIHDSSLTHSFIIGYKYSSVL